jgi:predicted ATPase
LWIEDGIGDYRATGSILDMPFLTALRAEALYLSDRISDALKAIAEVEELIERFENRYWCAELHRLKGVLLMASDADETEIEASFFAAIRTAKEQKSISLEKRAEGTYAEYRRQRVSASGGRRGFRIPLW